MFRCCGILLAAGSGSRFDASGVQNKLLAPLPDGNPTAVASSLHLISVIPTSIAVVRADSGTLALLLTMAGINVSICPDAALGMAHSLAHGIAQCADADAWIIVLGDMPYLLPSTIAAVRNALEQGADMVVPSHLGKRGHPVGFSKQYLPDLLALRGDQGARDLLKKFPVTEIVVEDAGILYDIDLVSDIVSTIPSDN